MPRNPEVWIIWIKNIFNNIASQYSLNIVGAVITNMNTTLLISSINDFLCDYLYRQVRCYRDNLDEVVLALVGAVLWRSSSNIQSKDDNSVASEGKWLSFNVEDRRYVLCYSSRRKQFHLVRDSRAGTVIHSFDNTCSTATVQRVFSEL